MTDRLRIIGWGNVDREDDGAGIVVARRLLELGIPALCCSGDAISLIDAWKGAASVVIVDAIVTGAPAGSLQVWDVSEAQLPRTPAATTHGLGLGETIALARSLGQLPPTLRVYGIEAAKFGFGSDLSPAVANTVDKLVSQIAAEFKQR